jgi:hypothetical protein
MYKLIIKYTWNAISKRVEYIYKSVCMCISIFFSATGLSHTVGPNFAVWFRFVFIRRKNTNDLTEYVADLSIMHYMINYNCSS